MVKNRHFDVVIVGGGPAGLAALLWSVDLGLAAVLFEKKAEFGGQLLRTYNPVTNYPGARAANGRELRNVFLRQLSERDALRCADAEIVATDLEARSVTTGDGSVYSGHAVILATGVRRRRLGVPGEEELRGHGVLDSGVKQRDEVAGRHVVIVGGGDAALENALLLADRAAKVSVVHRRDIFTARKDFLERASQNPRIEFLTNAVLRSIDGEGAVGTVTLEDVRSGKRSTLAADRVLIRVGVQPNTELFRGQIELDDDAYVVTDRNCATSRPDIYAIGDVANPRTPTIAAAVGQASVAVKAILGRCSGRD